MAAQDRKENAPAKQEQKEEEQKFDPVAIDFLQRLAPHTERFEVRPTVNGDFLTIGGYDTQNRMAVMCETSLAGAEELANKIAKAIADKESAKRA